MCRTARRECYLWPMPPHYIEPISRCWLRRTNFLESVLSPPLSLSLFSASQQTRGAHHLFAHMRSHMSVKTQEDPLNLHIFHLDVLVMKNKSNKDLRWPLLELLKSSTILFIVLTQDAHHVASTTTPFSCMTRPGCWMSLVTAKGGRT